LAAWITSGRVLDAILVGMALEGAVLAALWRVSRRGIAPGALLPNLLSGMCLLVAMRAALTGGWWGWVSLPLLGALVFHVYDLSRRWRR
jgi:peptidoglycan/LPS O-acetylase OafA/YrhL